jgi:polyferredoxin
MGPAMGTITGAMIIFGSLFIFSLFMGRIFCGYICPMGGMQDAMGKIRERRIKRRSFFVKWLIFIPWLALMIFLPFMTKPEWQGIGFFNGIGGKVDFFGMEGILVKGVSILSLHGLLIYYIIIILLLILGFAVGKRSFCHHVCWIGPFMIIGRWISNKLRIPSLRLQAQNEKCNQCKRCDRACPMSLEVHEFVIRGDMEDSNCILCGECIETCPRNVIQYKFCSHTKAIVPKIFRETDLK